MCRCVAEKRSSKLRKLANDRSTATLAQQVRCPGTMRPSSAAESTPQAMRVLEFPRPATLNAGRLLAELSNYSETVDAALEQLVVAIEQNECVPFAYVRAAAQGILCAELAHDVSLRLADALALVPDPALTEAFADVLEGTRVDGDSLLVTCALRVLRGRAHYKRLSMLQRRLVNAQAQYQPHRSQPPATVVHLHEWAARRRCSSIPM